MVKQIPIAKGLFTWPSEEPHLIGSRCTECGNHMFPVQQSCASCSGTSIKTLELANEGQLWTWTIQGYPPKSPPYKGETDPKKFIPFGVGYVELPGQVKVESRLTLNDSTQLEFGMQMQMQLIPLYTDDDGSEVLTYAFTPKKATK